VNKNNNKAEKIESEEDLLAKIDKLFQDRHSTDFLEQIESLGSLDIKRKLLNTLKLIENIKIPNIVAECCNKPLFTNLQVEKDTSVLDLLFDNEYESSILAALQNIKSEDRKNIWPLAVKNNSIKIIMWLISYDLININTPNKDGYTSGALAVLHAQKDIAFMLKKAGGHFGYITNEAGQTLWHIAAAKNDSKLINNCIEYGITINVADRKGYTAAYYLADGDSKIFEKAKSKLLDFNEALKSDVFNAVRQSDLVALNKLLTLGVSAASKNAVGYSLLDIALIINHAEIIQILRSHRAKISLFESVRKQSNIGYTAVLDNPHESYTVEVNKVGDDLHISLGQLNSAGITLSKLEMFPWKKNEGGKTQGTWKVISKGASCYILMSKSDTTAQPDLFCEVSSEGKLKLLYVNLPAASLQLSTYDDFIFDSIAAVKNLYIKSKNINFSENSKIFNGHTLKLEANSISLNGTHAFQDTKVNTNTTFRHKGDFVSELFTLKAESASFFGQLMIPNKAEIDVEIQFNCDGSIVMGKAGKIKAHEVQVLKNGRILVQQGELNIYAFARLENSGSIIGDQIFLSSGIILINNYGALIKGQTCLLTAPQTNQGGFLLSGQKVTLSYVDWGLNFMQTALKLAELGAYINPPTALTLRGYLLATKTVYRGGEIFYKAMNSEEINSSEVITLIMDNVIPCLGTITSHEEQAKLLVNILYQCYGQYQSEEMFIKKGLLIIESLSRLVRLSSFGMLSEENLIFLQTAADYLRYSRMGLKVASLSVDTIRGLSNNDITALEKAKSSFGAMAETALREYAYTLEPVELFNTNIQLPARDLAVFVLNKGYRSDLFLQALLFGGLHAAKREGLITSEIDLQIDTAIRSLLKTKHWASLFHAYQQGRLTKHAIANEAISSLLLILGNPLVSDALNRPQISVEPTVESIEEDSTKPVDLGLNTDKEPELVAKTEPEEEPTAEAEPESLTILKLLQEETIELDARLKLANTEEDRQELSERRAYLLAKVLEQGKQVIPPRVLQDINIDPIKFVESALTKSPSESAKDIPLSNQVYTALIEIQKAFNGEYAAEGYLGAFADAFHNDELISANGNVGIYSGKTGTNAGQMHATGGLGLFGQDVHNRGLDGKVRSESLANLIHTQFTNFEKGVITAQEAISLYCVGLVENFGSIDSRREIIFLANRIVNNHKKSNIIAKEDVNILCDLLADNKGVISGGHVTFEGSKQSAVNSGKIFGVDKIRLISEKLASNEAEGQLVAPEVDYEASEINKEGSIQSALVRTLGYAEAETQNLIWKKNDQDSIGALLLKAKATDKIDADAFSNVRLLDVTLTESFEKSFTFHVSQDFSNILQFHLPQDDKSISIYSLPKLSSEATFILDAPGHYLDATSVGSEYNSHFRFTGQAIAYSLGKTTFNESVAFAVNQMTGLGGSTEFYLKKGGFVQSEALLNQGYFHSDGIINWNLGSLDNDAQLENYINYLYKNKREKDNGVTRECLSTRLVENSGKIYALGHQGHLGVFNQHGGSFTSGSEGQYVYHSGGCQKAILIHESRQTAEVIEDGGQNWHVMPIWHSAEIGSAGQNVLIGLEKFNTAGLDFYGDKETFLYAAKGVENVVQETSYHIPATESRTKSGKFQKYVHDDVKGFIQTQIHISSQNGEVRIFAPQGSIHLQNAIIASEKDAFFLAKDQVVIEGVESNFESAHKESKRHGLFNHQIKKSETIENKVYSSYLISNESLTICCDELILKAVKGSIAGDCNVLAKTATFDGKQQTFNNVTKTKEFTFSMPAIDNLKSITQGQNAKVIFGNLLRTYGWNNQELQNILHAKSIGELPKSVVNFARDIYNLTAFVAHACNELGKSPTDFAGAITDKMGLTTTNDTGERVVDPRFSFKFTKTTERTQSSQSVSTDFVVGGTFRMIGDTLYLLDGATIDAEHLRVFLTEGIKATYGLDKFTYGKVSKSVGIGVSALNPQDVDISLSLSKTYKQDETHHLAKLHARDSIEIIAGHKIEGALQIQAEGSGSVTAQEMDFETRQDIHITKTLEVGVHASTGGSSAGASFQKGKQEEHQTLDKAGITLRSGTVYTNHLNLQNGSRVEANLLFCKDGQAGLPTVTGTDAKDSKVQKSTGFSVEAQPKQGMSGKASVGAEASYEKVEILQRATVIASNVTQGSLPGINTDASTETEVITHKKRAIALPAISVNMNQIDKVKKIGSKALPLLFKVPESKPTKQVEATEELVVYSYLDNPTVQKHMAEQLDNSFGEVLSLGMKKVSDDQNKEPQIQDKEKKISKKKKKPENKKVEKGTPSPLISGEQIHLMVSGELPENGYLGSGVLPKEMLSNILKSQIKPIFEEEDPSVVLTMTVAAGRSMVNVYQGVKQFALATGEKVGVVDEGNAQKYTNQINQEKALYEKTKIGESNLGKATENIADFGIGFAVPPLRVAKFGGMLVEGAIGGMILGGLAPTDDGSLLSNLENAAKGTLQGAAESAIIGAGTKKIKKIAGGVSPTTSMSISKPVVFSPADKTSSGTKPVTSSFEYNASNVNAQVALNKKMTALENAKKDAVKTEKLPDGTIRYYNAEKPASKPGVTRGSAYVTEYTPSTGHVSSYNINYNHAGNITRVQTRMVNGQNINAPSYATKYYENTKRPK
jgi:ankyrin repeat protein